MATEVFTSSSSGSRSTVRVLHPSQHFLLAEHVGSIGPGGIQDLVGGGYLRDRGTGMSDLVITSRPLLLDLLSLVQPYVIFKREHVRRALGLLPRLERLKDRRAFLATCT